MLSRVEATAQGKRLDQYLAGHFGQMGLRGWRRAIVSGTVLLDGHKASPATRLQGFEELQIVDSEKRHSALKGLFLGSQGDYLFFFKPAGLHSVTIAGNCHDSLEAQTPELCRQQGISGSITLLQRLDQGTSGLICAATTPEAATRYRHFEREGQCRKSYLALLTGILDQAASAKNALAVNGGKKVRIMAKSTPQKRFWTFFEPLWHGHIPDCASEVTIAKCELCAGQRHQVRAHAASLGMPLLGDSLYGSNGHGAFALVHYRIEFPGCAFQFLSPQSPFTALGCELGANGVLQCM